MSALDQMSARELLAGIARRELRVEAVAQACLERIALRDPVVGAWVHLDAESVLAEARRLDASSLRGPLHGIPVGVKDLIDTIQYPTAYGSPIYTGHRPVWDAACVASARAAGALVLGKTVTTEFATFHPGKTTNPRNPLCTPGGSSSGSAAAVADSMVPLAYGTQTAGSVIRPAAYCGVVGFKPGFGRVSRAGVKLLSESLDTVGVFARDVADAALFAGVLAGCHWTLPERSGSPRLGLCRTKVWDQAEPAAIAVFESVVSQCADRGAQVVDRVLPAVFDQLFIAQTEIMAFELSHALSHEFSCHGEQLSAPLSALIRTGQQVAPERYDEHLRLARECRSLFDALFAEVDAVLTLSAPGEAPEGLGSTGDPVFNRIWTLLGAPCIHLPAGTGGRGLPLGVQIVGQCGADFRLLAVADWVFQCLRRE